MTTSLVPSYQIVVFDYAQANFESLTIEEKIKAIQAKKEKIGARLTAISIRISRMTSIINENNEFFVKSMEELKAEIRLLEEERVAHIRKSQNSHGDDDEELDRMFEDFERFEQARHEDIRREFESIRPKNRDMKCNKLFRKIAKLTHPDKTKDPEKHKLFILARAYFNDENYEGLENILRILQGKASNLFDRLFKRLQEEIQELEVAEKNLKAVIASEDYQLLALFERNQQAVLEIVEKELAMKVHLLRSQRDNLLIALGKEAKPGSRTWTTFHLG